MALRAVRASLGDDVFRADPIILRFAPGLQGYRRRRKNQLKRQARACGGLQQ
jgi:hypothetical protein